MKMKKHLRAAGALLLCLSLGGCIGVTPLPKVTRTPQGVEEKTVDLDFIQPGTTTRAEVRDKLKLIDTGLQSERFFLGRWSSSSSGGWIFLVGLGGGVGNASRIWKSGDLLVEFDSAGLVTKSETFNDSHLNARLLPVAAEATAVAPETVELSVTYWKANREGIPAKVTLSASAFDFEELGTAKKKHKFTLPVKDVELRGSSLYAAPDPVKTKQTLRFAHDLKSIGGPRGKTFDLEMTLPQLVTLMSRVSNAPKKHVLEIQ
jgi:hypothetical protein